MNVAMANRFMSTFISWTGRCLPMAVVLNHSSFDSDLIRRWELFHQCLIYLLLGVSGHASCRPVSPEDTWLIFLRVWLHGGYPIVVTLKAADKKGMRAASSNLVRRLSSVGRTEWTFELMPKKDRQGFPWKVGYGLLEHRLSFSSSSLANLLGLPIKKPKICWGKFHGEYINKMLSFQNTEK